MLSVKLDANVHLPTKLVDIPSIFQSYRLNCAISKSGNYYCTNVTNIQSITPRDSSEVVTHPVFVKTSRNKNKKKLTVKIGGFV